MHYSELNWRCWTGILLWGYAFRPGEFSFLPRTFTYLMICLIWKDEYSIVIQLFYSSFTELYTSLSILIIQGRFEWLCSSFDPVVVFWILMLFDYLFYCWSGHWIVMILCYLRPRLIHLLLADHSFSKLNECSRTLNNHRMSTPFPCCFILKQFICIVTVWCFLCTLHNCTCSPLFNTRFSLNCCICGVIVAV